VEERGEQLFLSLDVFTERYVFWKEVVVRGVMEELTVEGVVEVEVEVDEAGGKVR